MFVCFWGEREKQEYLEKNLSKQEGNQLQTGGY